MKFNNNGQAVEPKETVARWQRHLGLMAKDHTLFGLDVFDWREFRIRLVKDKGKSKNSNLLLFTLISSCWNLTLLNIFMSRLFILLEKN